ncbi:MAG: mannose-phosphate guanylyltransferase [Pseudonocardiales bacterium]|nr:mannose-phosphate guanylyltransferase [Pseudonocardiales bacterium]
MEAIVLVGGQGTRLRPLTISTPKPMLPAAGVPFLTHQLARARTAGIEHVVLATSYRAEVFSEHFGDGSSLGLRIDYVTETDPLGTGGGIRNVVDRLESGPSDPIVVLNGDILSGHDIPAQIAAHRAAGAVATLHLVRVDDPSAFGSVPTDDRGRVTAFVEKSPEPVTNQVNAGCYVFDRALIDTIPAGRVVSVEHETFPALLAAGAVVVGYVEDAYWLDVGTPAAYVRASADLVRGVVASSAVERPGDAWVSPSARVVGAARVSGGSAVGPDVAVEAGSTVDGSIVMDGATVGSEVSVLRSVIGRGAELGDGCRLVDAVVGDGARLGEGNELTSGARVWPGVRLPDCAVRFSSDA